MKLLFGMKLLKCLFFVTCGSLMAGTLTSFPGLGGGIINLHNLFGDAILNNVAGVASPAPTDPIHFSLVQNGSSGGGGQCGGFLGIAAGGAPLDCDLGAAENLHGMLGWLGGNDFQFTVAPGSLPISLIALEAFQPLPGVASDFVFDRSVFDINTLSSPVNGTAFFGNRAIINGTLTNYLTTVEIDFDTPLLAGQSVTFSADIDRVSQLPEPSTMLLSGLGIGLVLLLKRRRSQPSASNDLP